LKINLTEESFKQKFKTAKPEVNEAPGQFLARLESYLIRWIELAAVVQDFDGLKILMVKEQYLESCSVPLAVFLRERKPDLGELARLAEQYLEAHANSKTTVKKSEKEGFSSSSAFPQRSQRLRVFVEPVQARRLASLVENWVSGKPVMACCKRLTHKKHIYLLPVTHSWWTTSQRSR